MQGQQLTMSSHSYYWEQVRRFYAGQVGQPDVAGLDFYFATKHAGASWLRNVVGISRDDLAVQLGHKSDRSTKNLGRREQALVDLYSHPDDLATVRRILNAVEGHAIPEGGSA
jgi:hypothetical protein